MEDSRKDTEFEREYFPDETEHKEVLKSIGNRDFIWDEAKNKRNLKIHHVDFETAMFVFNDDNRIEIYDELHSEDEDRWNTIGKPMEAPLSGLDEMRGMAPKLTLGKVHDLLFVVYTDRIIMGKEMVRLISARKASKFEEMLYINNEV